MDGMTIKAAVTVLAISVPALATMPFAQASESGSSAKFGHQAEATEQLQKEHEITSKIVEAAEKTSTMLNSGKDVDKKHLADLHDFFVNFVDACHHRKEEQYYFPAAVVAEPNLKSVVATLKMHHDLGKALLSGVDRALAIWEESPQRARREARENLDAYTTLLRRHIDVESNDLMQPANDALPGDQKDLIRMGFHYVEAEDLGEGFHEKYHSLAMNIIERMEE